MIRHTKVNRDAVIYAVCSPPCRVGTTPHPEETLLLRDDLSDSGDILRGRWHGHACRRERGVGRVVGG
jgi:hypothetical protein